MVNSSRTLPWACPVCQQALECGEHRWFCENNHSFDLAKSGYANLLLAHQKASKQPGDSAEMLKARRDFLNAGHFQPIAQAVGEAINRHISRFAREPFTLLDTGCGEGYYLRQLNQLLQGQWLTAGLDIAKDGVQLAARSDKTSTWVCASSARIPLIDQSLDALLRIFAPGDAEQSLRVLRDSGLLVTVTPAAAHLLEIKQALYKTVTLHPKPTTPCGFEAMHEQEITYTLTLNTPEQIRSLLAMTPFFWRGQRAGREELQQRTALTVTVAVWVSCYRKREQA